MEDSSFLNPVPRSFPGMRWVRISLRTLHLICMGLWVGGIAAGQIPESLSFALWGTVISGLLFVVLELFHSPVILVQVKGLAVFVKMMLLLAAVEIPEHALAVSIVAIVIGGISSHMPGRYRYYSIFHGKVVDGGSG